MTPALHIISDILAIQIEFQLVNSLYKTVWFASRDAWLGKSYAQRNHNKNMVLQTNASSALKPPNNEPASWPGFRFRFSCSRCDVCIH